MAESRRVQLTRLSCDVVPSSSDKPPASVQKSPSGVLQGKENGPDRPADTDTVRLVLTLSEPDERSFSEFSYSQLIDNKTNHRKDEVPLNRFEEGEKRANDEVAALSRKFEEKYGGKPKTKKDRIQDLIDIGYGYDEEDSFIDNSEPYDEFVPASITTKFGGFYVNSGVLHFRQASETVYLPTEEKTLEPPKKRKVNGRQDKPKKCCREGGEMMSNVDSKSSASSEIGLGGEIMKKKKKKNAVGTLSVTSMLKKFQREKEKERQKMVKSQMPAAIMGEVTIPLCPADAGGGGGSGLTDPLVSLIGSTNDHALIQAANTVDFDIDLDSLLDVSEETFSPKLVPQPGTETQLFRPKTDGVTPPDASPHVQPLNTKTNLQKEPHSEQMQLLSQTSSNSPHQCVPLPEGLAPQLEDSIKKLTTVAKTSEGESKLKFFTPEINSILLDIELQCRDQGGQLRSKVYTHLSSFLPCSRDTLLKRVKKLLLAHITEEPRDVEVPMQKLKEAIGRAMPEQIACFNENCQVYEQLKKAAEEEKEGKQKVNVGPEDNVEEKGGRRGGPKKLFKWNEEIRESLCHVLRLKMERYKKERKGSQEMEEYLKTLLENEVKPLWPKGWMQSRLLIRESRKMLNIFASLPVKRARSEKKRPSISGPPTTSDGCRVLQGSSLLAGLPQDTDDVFIESSNISNYLPLAKQEAAALRKVEDETGRVTVDAGSSTPTAADKPRVSATSSQTHSLLDLLAEQALAREQHFSVPQELLAAAVAKYKLSLQRCSFGVDTRSPPLAPPPPQSSPVGFPLSGMCKVALPQLLPVGDFTRRSDADHVQIISDDEDIIMQ
ncbi:ubinuclein-1 isoform X1 [Etheostoma spectabile]|uniref:ubinuclein-1 isoform X1 n=1 Tax=Etheostoma spectabile TaxID=54343 RepID=UPI0013AED624|nr:ubinuclein-1-like isoform X1 [Etheostoma spectabile]